MELSSKVKSFIVYRDETSRHQYYLQLRHNVAVRNLAYTYVAEDIIYLLVGLALQADFGDYIESQHKENYFLLHEYFPEQVIFESQTIDSPQIKNTKFKCIV